jgi:2-polyprenyl-6-methoxyphenol hydroxylase-like FAD-dependent oxidoreductase
MRAIVIGGSLGGLYTAIVLSDLGWEVDVFERSERDLRGRGGGIVLQPELEWFLTRAGSSPVAVGVPLSYRQYLARDGTSQRRWPAPQLMTSWDRLFNTARDAFSGGRYHHGKAAVSIDPGDSARVGFADGTVGEGDLVVFADGIRSTGRRLLAPEAAVAYAGYVAWRGLVPEHQLPDSVAERLHDTFTFFEPISTQFLCYFVPARDGATERGRRRLNWVWYVNIALAELGLWLGLTSEQLQEEIPPGRLSVRACDQLRQDAQRRLPEPLAAVVAVTAHPFAQAIFDVATPRMAYTRACLVGDAAFVVRPHTAAGTAKAAGDAITLGRALKEGDVNAGLERWNARRVNEARALAVHGKRLAAQWGLGATSARPSQP